MRTDLNQLGPFTLLVKLGEGGMGVVYKALDTRLERLVAIKVLPEARMADPERRARFMQEARAASALNHPNIITIHDIAEHDGRHYIVMELVEGKPLDTVIPQKGLPVQEAVRIAVQIADALAAAHAAGIVHRDLKPGNIMLDAPGRAKVLDFGLAKLTAANASAAPDDATRTILQAKTEEGAILGSISYMSPEQAEGRPVDARSDIFSFGAVLYEMVTGRQAFHGESRISTLAAVVEREPQPVGEGVPAELAQIISRCLRKDAARRSQSMADVKVALEELRDQAAAVPAKRRWLWPAVAAACVLVAIAAVVWGLRGRGSTPSAPAQLVRLSPDDGNSYLLPSVSPDGKFVAMISERSGDGQVWLQQVAGGDPIQVTRSAVPLRLVKFFPDGAQLLVWAQRPDRSGTFEVIPTLGGQSRVLVSGRISGPAVSPDGTKVAYIENATKNRVLVIPVAGGAPVEIEKWPLTQGRAWFLAIDWLDNKTLLAAGAGKPDAPGLEEWDWFAVPTDGRDPTPMGVGPAFRQAGISIAFGIPLNDALLFSGTRQDRTNVWSIGYSPGTWRVNGPPRQLTFGTENELPMHANRAGTLAVQSLRDFSDLYLLPVDPATGHGSGAAQRLTKDGRLKRMWMVGGEPGKYYFDMVVRRPSGTVRDAFSVDLATQQEAHVVSGGDFNVNMVFSPDGRLAAYQRPDGTSFSISIAPAGAPADSARPLCSKCGQMSRFTPDSKYLAVIPEVGPDQEFNGKMSTVLVEVSSGKIVPLLSDPQESLTISGFFANDWAIIRRDLPRDKVLPVLYLAQWRDGGLPPQSEWRPFERPSPNWNYSPSQPLLYGFDNGQLVGKRFDLKQRRFSEVFPVKIPAGGPVEIKAEDAWSVRGPGITFTRRQTIGSVWLTKLPQ